MPKIKPRSSATFAHVNFIFLIVGSGALLVAVDRPWNIRVLLGPFREKIDEMVEPHIREPITAVQSVSSTTDGPARRHGRLQAQVERFGRASGERKIGVDTWNLGRPSQFNGTDSACIESRDAAR